MILFTGICGVKCRLAGSLRIISGTEWTPELANRDTEQFKDLANEIKSEVSTKYSKHQTTIIPETKAHLKNESYEVGQIGVHAVIVTMWHNTQVIGLIKSGPRIHQM